MCMKLFHDKVDLILIACVTDTKQKSVLTVALASCGI